MKNMKVKFTEEVITKMLAEVGVLRKCIGCFKRSHNYARNEELIEMTCLNCGYITRYNLSVLIETLKATGIFYSID